VPAELNGKELTAKVKYDIRPFESSTQDAKFTVK
jgi:hypothetical protein